MEVTKMTNGSKENALKIWDLMAGGRFDDLDDNMMHEINEVGKFVKESYGGWDGIQKKLKSVKGTDLEKKVRIDSWIYSTSAGGANKSDIETCLWTFPTNSGASKDIRPYDVADRFTEWYCKKFGIEE